MLQFLHDLFALFSALSTIPAFLSGVVLYRHIRALEQAYGLQKRLRWCMALLFLTIPSAMLQAVLLFDWYLAERWGEVTSQPHLTLFYVFHFVAALSATVFHGMIALLAPANARQGAV